MERRQVEKVFKQKEAGFGNRTLATDAAGDEIRRISCERQGIGRGDAEGNPFENKGIEYAVPHVDNPVEGVMLLDPLASARCADKMEGHFHVLGNALAGDLKASLVAGDKENVHIRREEGQRVVVVGAELLHNLAFGRIIERPVRHDAVDIKNEDFRRKFGGSHGMFLKLRL